MSSLELNKIFIALKTSQLIVIRNNKRILLFVRSPYLLNRLRLIFLRKVISLYTYTTLL